MLFLPGYVKRRDFFFLITDTTGLRAVGRSVCQSPASLAFFLRITVAVSFSSVYPAFFPFPHPSLLYRFTIVLDDWMLLSSEQQPSESNTSFRDETLKTYKTLTSLYSSLCNHLQVSNPIALHCSSLIKLL